MSLPKTAGCRFRNRMRKKEDRLKHDLYHNGSGVRDPVACRAIREADRQPENVENAIRRMKTIAGWHDCEVVNRIALRDKKTGRIWP